MLTDVKIRNAKAKEKHYKLHDKKGLYVLVRNTGRKYFRCDYRFAKKRNTLSLGVYPDVSLRDARAKRDEAKALIRDNIDPSQHKKETKLRLKELSENDFESIAREWFQKQRSSWSDGHSIRVIRRLELNVFPYLGTRPIKLITAPDLLEVLRRVELRGACYSAQVLKRTCGQIFRFAIATGRADRDPAADLRGALTTTKTKHMSTITDLKKIGALLRAIGGYDGFFITQCALKLAPLVFVRPGELRHAEWAEIALEDAVWKIPANKMKAGITHIVPLSRQAVEIFKMIEPVTGRGRYVFPSIRSTVRPMSNNTVNAALRRLGYSKEEMTGHGFRSMASTILHEQGWPTDVIERQLAHTETNSVKAAYDHAKHLPERRKMMQHWADYLEVQKAGGR